MGKGKTLIIVLLVLLVLGLGVLLFVEVRKMDKHEDVPSIVGVYEREEYVCGADSPSFNDSLEKTTIEFKEDKTFIFKDYNCFAAEEFYGTYELQEDKIVFSFAPDSASFEGTNYYFKNGKIEANNIEFTKK